MTAPPRPVSLERLAVDTFREGSVGETMAALAALRAAEGCEEPSIREALLEIAEDETRHAALAWRTLAWALEQGGPSVARALLAERERAGAALDGGLDGGCEGERSPALARLGRLDAASRAAVRRDAWRTVIEPLLGALVAMA